MRDLRGLVGWPGGVRGWVGDCEEAWAVVLLGLGLLLGLFWGCLHLRYRGNRTGSDLSHKQPTLCSKPAVWGGGVLASLVLASPFSEWFSSFASASAFSFAFLVFLSSFLSFTAFSFCGGREQRCRLPRGGEQSHSGQGSLTFAAFLAFGSGLGWAGFYDNNRKESSNCNTYTSLSNKQFSLSLP